MSEKAVQSQSPEDKARDATGKSSPRKAAVPDALISAISKTDETILRLNTLLSTKPGLDATLSTLNYTSLALHHLLASAPLSRLRLGIRLWLLRRLGRDTSAVPVSAAPSASSPLLALANLISKTRFTIRLLGLVALWKWGSTTIKSPPKDPVLRVISYIEVLSLVIYQSLENITYLATNEVIDQNLFKRVGGIRKWSLWSIRAWFTYVLLQFVRLSREALLFNQQEEERKKRRAEEISAGEKAVSAHLAEDADIEVARQAEIRNWRKRLVSNAAWAPLCAHWSFENGIGVPPSMIGFIGLLAGGWGTYDLWQATA